MYLGLVLVGGSAPQVFAHGALTRNFELQDEIEVHDDLETKPDNETAALSISIKNYLEDVENFLGTLRRLGEKGSFDPLHDRFEVTQSTILPCLPANKVGSYTANTFELKNESLRPSLERFSKLLTDGYSLADCLSNSRFKAQEATSSKFTFKLDEKALEVQFSVQKSSPEIARRLSIGLGEALLRFTPDAAKLARQKIFENTSFKSKNDQVLIITRLPRAALDPLLSISAE